MSTPDSTKKRRVATDNNGGVNNGVDDDGTTMSTILAKLNDMTNEMNGMKSRLSRMDELENKYQRQEEECSLLKVNCNALEKTVKILDTRCESLQRSVQILSKENVLWEYSAPPIPLSHWRGFPEDYVDRMQYFLADIKRHTCALRSGEQVVDSIRLGQVDGHIFLQHDDTLLAHWKELANALQLHELNHYKIQIINVQLTSEVLDILAPALKGKPVRDFVLERNRFANNNQGARFTTECIKSNNELQHFEWVNNQISNVEDAKLLVDAIVNNPSVTKVSLDNCFGGISNSYEILRPIFASDKTWDLLDLERNNIITEGDTTIPDYIASNPPLKILYLAGNKLNDNDAKLIAKALRGNTNLKNLRIHNNSGITDIGNNVFAKAINDPTSLNSMSNCNHACTIQVDSSRGMNSIHLVSSGRGSKIYKLLSGRNKEGSNVQHLNSEFDGEDEEEDSLKLVPKVLECVHRYAKVSQLTVHPLSIIYEIVRGWKMPELYEKRS